MLKKLLTLSILLTSVFTYAQDDEEEKAPPPLDPKYMRPQKMALVNAGSTIYAVNMFTYKEPYNVQIVYGVDFDQNSIISLVRDADLVTIQTEAFNLQRLMRQEEEVSTVADIYLGHFDNGGFKAYEKAAIHFSKPIYVRELVDLDPSSRSQKYDVVDIKRDERMLIHQVQTAPSYSHIMIQDSAVNCIRQFTTSSATPSEHELFGKLAFCGSLKPMYYEVKE
ncbi:hypothetical protein EYS14_02550 [Alteromonadaceae bacterium M269]|nr:hypothetical protein EYS14_02550 [Alteromonadaceae bacterium M269]